MWDILEDLSTEGSDSEEEESPPPKKFHQEEEPKENITEPSKSQSSSAPLPNTVIPMSEGSLHDSGISQFSSSCLTEKPFICVLLIVDIVLKVKLLLVPILVRST